jgi:uncharacterized protein YuzE
LEIAKSINNIPIRLTNERWIHIVENHDDLAGYFDDVLLTIESPDYVIKGYQEALIALKQREEGKFLAVVYKESGRSDGFIITAYLTLNKQNKTRKRGDFMATAEIEKTLKEVNELVSHFIKMPETKMWIDYDKEADVLYISFKRPQHATDSEMLENGILLRYKGEELVGITVLNASKRKTV